MGRIAGLSAEDTKKRLLEAAADIFAESGYEGAKVSQIAKRAGMTTGAIYSHYENKGSLLCDAIREHGKTALLNLLATVPGGSPLELLRIAGYQLPFKSPEDVALVIEAAVAARRDDELSHAIGSDVKLQENFIKELLEDAQQKGEVSSSLPADAVAHLAMIIGLGSVITRALKIEPPDSKSWEIVIDRLIASIS